MMTPTSTVSQQNLHQSAVRITQSGISRQNMQQQSFTRQSTGTSAIVPQPSVPSLALVPSQVFSSRDSSDRQKKLSDAGLLKSLTVYLCY